MVNINEEVKKPGNRWWWAQGAKVKIYKTFNLLSNRSY
jgi:hypothetical protein